MHLTSTSPPFSVTLSDGCSSACPGQWVVPCPLCTARAQSQAGRLQARPATISAAVIPTTSAKPCAIGAIDPCRARPQLQDGGSTRCTLRSCGQIQRRCGTPPRPPAWRCPLNPPRPTAAPGRGQLGCRDRAALYPGGDVVLQVSRAYPPQPPDLETRDLPPLKHQVGLGPAAVEKPGHARRCQQFGHSTSPSTVLASLCRSRR